jgi:tight adherence protein B
MMRSMARLTAALTVAVVTASTAANVAQAASMRLVPLRGTAFPDRAYVLSLPTATSLPPGSVVVRENGRTMAGVSVVPAKQAGAHDFGVVLVIDASKSMHGAAIRGAVAAARTFADERNPFEQIAVVTFNNRPTVVLPFTGDQSAIDQALATNPILGEGTHIYDAVDAGINLLKTGAIGSGSIILLSDGSDTGSRVTEAGVSMDARSAGVRLFTVGLRSGAFDRTALHTLATDSNGAYSEATSPADLAQIYQAIGSRLANDYVVRYRSSAPADTLIRVHVDVQGFQGGGDVTYRTPAPARSGGVYHRAFSQWFWRSNLSLAATVLACSLLIGWIVSAVLRPRRAPLRSRMAEFVTLRRPKSDRRQSSVFAQKLSDSADKSLEHTGWWLRFKEELEVADIAITPGQLALATAIATLLVGWLAFAVTGLAPLALVGMGMVLVTRSVVRRRLERKRHLFAQQLPDNLQVLASAMRAGHSFIGALSVVVEDSPEPSQSELRRVIADEQLGVPLEDALGRVVTRMHNKDLAQVALVATLQRDTGGNTAEVLDRVTETVRERFALRRLVKTLTAQGRMSRWIVTALPLVVAAAITAINPTYLKPLYATTGGRVLIAIACVLVAAGSFLIKRIVNIRV